MINAPHTVTVTTKVHTEDAAGAAVITDGPAYEVRGRMHQVTAGESSTGSPVSVFRFSCASWPGGHASTVTWDGREFSQFGEAVVRSAGRFTNGATVTLHAIGAVLK